MSDLFLRTKTDAQVSQERPDSTQQYVFGEGTNDVHIDQVDGLRLVTGTEKLVQDIIKILLTDKGSHPFLPLYGSGLHSLVGQKMDIAVLRGSVLEEVKASLILLQTINQNNPNLSEQIETLRTLKIDQSTPGEIQIEMEVLTRSSELVGLALTVI